MSLAASNYFFSTCPLNNWTTTETSELLGTTSTRFASQANFTVTRTSASILSLGNGASSTAPQYVRFAPARSRAITTATTLTIASGSGTGQVDIYGTLSANSAAGTLTFTVIDTSGCTFTGGTGVTVVAAPGASGLNPIVPPFSVLLWSWSITSGAFDSSNTGRTYPSGPIGDQQLSTDAWVDAIEFANITSGAVTVLITDGLGSPIQLFPTASVAANSVASYLHPGGRFFDGGIFMTAGTVSALQVNVRMTRVRRHQLNP